MESHPFDYGEAIDPFGKSPYGKRPAQTLANVVVAIAITTMTMISVTIYR
jgi:hypothetical protein